MTQRATKAPFPWFGGKSRAASLIWAALGDVNHYVEPFAGSLAVLLARPHLANRPYHSETVNDLDGLLVNAWRSIQMHPEATAEAASWPVAEADLHARHCALVRWRDELQLEHLMGDPTWCDPVMGGWWLWGVSAWIGSGWCSGLGAWWPDDTGRLARRGSGALGVVRKRPHLGDDGTGVSRPQMREPGVAPHDVTMPRLLDWLRALSARLRHVRIVNGDWQRVCTPAATISLSVRNGGACGVLLDPPYSQGERTPGLYSVDEVGLSDAVRRWCLANGEDRRYRIVLAGYEGEHGTALAEAGWRQVEWFSAGFLTGGMANTGDAGHQQRRERLWLSPHCLQPATQATLFDLGQQ